MMKTDLIKLMLGLIALAISALAVPISMIA